MHNVYKPLTPENETRLITDWVRHKVRSCLPYSTSDSNKIVKELFRVHSKGLEMIDAYSNYHQSFKWTDLSEHIAFEISQLALRYMPTFRTNYSPFQRQIQDRKARKNPNLTGQSSTSSTNSNSSSSSSEADDSSTDEDLSAGYAVKVANQTELIEQEPFTLESVLPPMEEVYGCKITNPSKANMDIYRKYVQFGKLASGNNNAFALSNSAAPRERDNEMAKLKRGILKPLSNYGSDSYLQVKPPKVSEESQKIYAEYCKVPRNFNAVPKFEECDALYRYVQML